MIPQELSYILEQPNHAIVAANRPGKAPHVTTIWYLWDGDAFYFSITTDRAKYTNIKRDPAISLIIDDYAGHHYIAAYGRAEILTEGFEAPAEKLIRRYAAEEQLEAMRKMVMAPGRVMIKLIPEKIVAR